MFLICQFQFLSLFLAHFRSKFERKKPKLFVSRWCLHPYVGSSEVMSWGRSLSVFLDLFMLMFTDSYVFPLLSFSSHLQQSCLLKRKSNRAVSSSPRLIATAVATLMTGNCVWRWKLWVTIRRVTSCFHLCGLSLYGMSPLFFFGQLANFPRLFPFCPTEQTLISQTSSLSWVWLRAD